MIYQQKSRKKILISKLCADICWVIHYLCLGGTAGMIPNAVGIFRELIFLYRKKQKWAKSLLWPAVFIAINWALGFGTFHTWHNLLPITASSFVTVSLWIDNPKLTKIITVPICTAFLIYDIFVGSYSCALTDGLVVISNLLILIRESRFFNRYFNSNMKI